MNWKIKMRYVPLLLVLLLGCDVERFNTTPTVSDPRDIQKTTDKGCIGGQTTTSNCECVAKEEYEYHRFKMIGQSEGDFVILDLRFPKGSLELCELEKIQGCAKVKINKDNSDATLRFNYMSYKQIRNDNVIKAYESSTMRADFIPDVAGVSTRIFIGCAKTVGFLYVSFLDANSIVGASSLYSFKSENYADFRAAEGAKGEQLEHSAADSCFE